MKINFGGKKKKTSSSITGSLLPGKLRLIGD